MIARIFLNPITHQINRHMFRAVFAFLTARELCALSHVNAHSHALISREWPALQLARFPRKKHAPRKKARETPCNAREFLLGLEARVQCAPPYGMAWTFRASIWCDATHSRKFATLCRIGIYEYTLVVANSRLLLRGDIITDEVANIYIFDGVCGRPTYRTLCASCTYALDLSCVFHIPREFHISYYDYMRDYGVIVCCRISQGVNVYYTEQRTLCFDEGTEHYIFESRDMQRIREDIKYRISFRCGNTRDGAEHLLQIATDVGDS